MILGLRATLKRSRIVAMSLLGIKSIEQLKAESEEGGEHSLKRVLTALNLTTLGVGAIIGAGIFVLTGVAAAQYAGPAIVLSFVFAGVACAFAGLCYSEFASMIPIAGSAYTYGYATLGEIFAWIIGWDLILEYSVGAMAVAVGWSGYVVSFLRGVGIVVPPEIVASPGTVMNPSFAMKLVSFGKSAKAVFAAKISTAIVAICTA
jgi:APA family basic amino acid/polyamine antiporter